MGNQKTPKFSLVFLTWNAEEFILDTLNRAHGQDFDDYEIIVVDNGSEDETISIVEEEFGGVSHIRIVRNDKNLGFARGINRGIEKTEGDYICCYNHDTILSEGYLSTLNEYVTDDVVWTTARINYRVSHDQKCIRLMEKSRFTTPYSATNLTESVPVNFVPGDGVIVSRRLYTKQLNKRIFDPTMPPRGEDISLSVQLQSKGVPMRAIVDTYSLHPDKSQLYSPTLENLKELLLAVRSRVVATKRYTSSMTKTVYAMLSLITQPLAVHFRTFPRSEKSYYEMAQKKGFTDTSPFSETDDSP